MDVPWMFQMELAEIEVKERWGGSAQHHQPAANGSLTQKAHLGTSMVPEYGAVVCRAFGLARSAGEITDTAVHYISFFRLVHGRIPTYIKCIQT